jgi:hypothetical protein
VRNNNPGNIEKSRDRWKGLAANQPDSRFFTFSEAKWGIRAMARILQNYQKKYGLDTIEQVIDRWAPPVENNTSAYVKAVAKDTGFDKDQKLDLKRHDHLFPLVKAIIRHENGYTPYRDAEINEGLALAGVKPPAPPVQAPPKSIASAIPPKGRLKKAANENFENKKPKKQPPKKPAPNRHGFRL